MAQLCVTIGAPTLAALRERRDAATRYGDLVELRLDTLADPDPAGALAGAHGPGHRDVPSHVGGRALRRQRGGAAAAC